MTDITALNVILHDEVVGTISLLPGDRSIFAFEQSYIDNPNRNTLSFSFKDEFGGMLTTHPATGPNLLPFFANLLPEGALRRYLSERAGIKQVRELFLLWTLGQDLPGAVRVTPLDGKALPPLHVEETEAQKTARIENTLCFSLAGVQLKFSALRNGGKNGGLVIPASGCGGSWIVKLPAERFERVPENEFSFMSLARRIGINVPVNGLQDLKDIEGLPDGLGKLRGEKAFVIERFDRSSQGPVHIEDFAQVFRLRPEEKYGKASYRNIATVLSIETSHDDIAEFIRRLVFSTLIGNDDMHVKNWSLIYYDKKSSKPCPCL